MCSAVFRVKSSKTSKTDKEMCFYVFGSFLVPELFGKLQETPGNNFHLVS